MAKKDTTKSDSKARTASAAVFFNENKSIAGFGNPLRAVFTSVRELVENALDASEKRNIIPYINIRLRRLSTDEVSALMDIDKSRLKNKRLDFLQLSCRDNGVGVSRELIPQLFGTVLAGTKYGAQQTRGRFGLGSKMVLLYSMSTLDLPIQITTRPEGEQKTYRVKLLINLEKNQPIIVEDLQFQPGDPEFFDDFGTEIMVSFTGDWGRARNYVKEYFRQLAIITPYADFDIELPTDSQGEDDIMTFKRVVDELPDPPEVVPVHPWGTDVTTFRREMQLAEPEHNVMEFLVNNFMGVNEQSAKIFFEEVNVDPFKKPSELTDKEVRRIVHDGFNRALRESKEVKRKRDRVFKFDEPKGDALSPLGADRLRKGIEKELEPLFVEALTRAPRAYEGHPFVIELALGYGGGVSAAAASKAVSSIDNKIVYRFANRIPLVFGAGSDVITNVVNQIKWNEYGLTRQSEPLSIAVSLVSTKIPFPETSKEYIDKVEEIEEEIKLAIMQLGRKLRSYLSRSRRRQRERQRRTRFERYAPQTVKNILGILEKENLWNKYTGVQPERIIAALSSGDGRIGRSQYPRFKPIYVEPVWSYASHVSKLQNNDIYLVEQFLVKPNNELAKILKISQAKVDEMKRRTLLEGSKAGIVKDFNPENFVNSEIEKRFHTRESTLDLTRLSKAFPRRWIRNTWDYLVTPNDLLKIVGGYIPKLTEKMKLEIVYKSIEEQMSEDELNQLSQLLDSDFAFHTEPATAPVVTESPSVSADIDMKEVFAALELDDPTVADMLKDELDLGESNVVEKPPKHHQKKKTDRIYSKAPDLKYMIPTLEDLLDHKEVKKRKVTTKFELLIEMNHPTNPIDFSEISDLFIETIKTSLRKYGEVNPAIYEERIDSKANWLDGYTRNAFKRRKISTVQEFLKRDNEELQEINELLRALMAHLETSLKADPTLLRDVLIEPEYQGLLDALERIDIVTLEQLASLHSIGVIDDPNSTNLVNLLINKTKSELIESLIQQNSVFSLDYVKWIPKELEDELYQKEIDDINKLLRAPLNEFSKKTATRVIHIKKVRGTKLIGIESEVQQLNKIGIYCLEELIYSADYYYATELTEKTRKLLDKITKILFLPVSFLSKELVRVEDLLIDVGINTIGRFLIWPDEELALITGFSREWVNLIQEGFEPKEALNSEKHSAKLSAIETLLSETELVALKKSQYTSVVELATRSWRINFPKIEMTNEFRKLQGILLGPVSQLTEIFTLQKEMKNLSKALEILEPNGVATVVEFLEASPTHLLSKVKNKRPNNALEHLIIGIQSEPPESVNAESDIYTAIKLFKIQEKMKLSPSHLSEFSNDDIENLITGGIRSIYQVLSAGFGEISKLLNRPEKSIKKQFETSSLRLTGTPIAKFDSRGKPISIFKFEFEGVMHFTERDISAILNSGYSTIESLYYQSDSRTFEIYSLSWEVIKHVKALFRSPSVLISWHEEIPESELPPLVEGEEDNRVKFRYVTLSSAELKKLSAAKQTRVIDFLTLPTEQLAEILDWTVVKTKKMQTSTILQEVGIELEDVNLFRESDLKLLSELNIGTIEDLYFSTFEDTWNSSIIPWQAINTIKNVLKLPIQYVEEEISKEIVELLLKNKIPTILDFLLTGDPILSQKTGLPAERFENLKHALDFTTLVDTFDKSVCFIPEVNYYHAKNLIENKIEKVADFILAPDKTIANIMEIKNSEVKAIKQNISRTSISDREVEEGISLRDLKIFSRAEIRAISKSGVFESREIRTAQELMYHVSEGSFYSDPIIFRKINDMQRVLNVDLSRFDFILKEDLNALKKANIHTIEDIVFISVDVSYDPELDPIISYISNIFTDLRPLIAMGSLPATSASESEVEGTLLDLWLRNDKRLNKEFNEKVYDIFLLPLKSVRIGQLLHEMPEAIENVTLADACLAYGETTEGSLAVMKEALSTKSSLISIMNEARTPISVLDLSPSGLRALIDYNITTVESLILKDLKFLSFLTGESQKFFRELISNFSYGSFRKELEQYGIDLLRILTTDEEITKLISMGIQYVEQTLSIKDQDVKEAIKLLEYILGSNIFLIGYPGELELTRNNGAQTVIESIVNLRTLGMDPMSILDIVILGFRARYYYALPLKKKKKFYSDNRILCVQDLISFHHAHPTIKLDKEDTKTIEFFSRSSLYLNIKGRALEELVIKHKCSRVIDAVSYPLIGDLLDEVRTEYKDSGELELIDDVDIPLEVLKSLSSTVFRRFGEHKFSLQDVIAYPRLLDEYRGIKKSVYEAANKELNIPLSRILSNGSQVGMIEGISRLSTLICYLPEFYSQNREIFDEVRSQLLSEISVIPEAPFNTEEFNVVSTAFGTEVYGFHELWAISTTNFMAIAKSDSELSRKVRRIIARSFLSISSIDQFSREEVWILWKNEIYTVAKFLLGSAHLSKNGIISKKRYSEMIQLAVTFLKKKKKKEYLSLFEFATIFEVQVDHVENSDLMTLYSNLRHPLVRSRTSFTELHFALSQPVIFSRFIETLPLKDIKQILQAGIFTIADFLVYPEGLDNIPKELNSIEKRLKLLEIGHQMVRKDLDIGVLDIPEELRDSLLSKNISTLSRLISFYLNPENSGLKSVFTSSLRYSKIEPSDIEKLASIGVETFLDLFIAPDLLFQDLLGVDENWAFERFIGFSYSKIAEKMEKAFLPLESIQELSKKSVKILNESNYYSILDIPDSFDESIISRNDFKVLQTLKQILLSPVVLLLKNIKDKSLFDRLLEWKNSKIRELLDVDDDAISELFSSIDSSYLLSLIDLGRPMSVIEGVRNPEQRIFKNSGLFTFSQIAKENAANLVGFGVEEDRARKIIEELNLPVESIFGLDSKILKEAQDKSIKYVYELLDDPRFYHFQVEKSLVLRTPTKIEDIFSEDVLKYMKSKKIDSVSKLLSSKSFRKDVANDDEASLKVVQILHSDIREVKQISDRWNNSLYSIGVKKIWQFYTYDEEEISKAVNVSVLSIIDTKNSINLDIKMVQKPEILVAKTLLKDYTKYGLTRLSDFNEEVLFYDILSEDKEAVSRLKSVVASLSRGIWKTPSFWKLKVPLQEQLAKLGVVSVNAIPGKLEEFTGLINSAMSDEVVSEIPMSEIALLSDLKVNGKMSFQHWFYLYHGKREGLNDKVTKILRLTIDNIEGVNSKAIITAFRKNITHISDIVTMSPEEFSMLVGLKAKNKLENFVLSSENQKSLYHVGLYPESKIQGMEDYFNSWLAVLGNSLENDFIDQKGITRRSFSTMMEVIDTPIWMIIPIRDLGYTTINKLTKLGVRTLSELLICRSSDLQKEMGLSADELNNFFKSISRAIINKSLSKSEIPLSISRKIRVTDLEELQKQGITDTKQVIFKDYKLSKNHPLLPGIKDVERILSQPVDEITWNEDSILALKKNKIKTIKEVVTLSDSKLRTLCGVSNAKLKDFRKKLPRKPGKIVSNKGKVDGKIKAPAKKATTSPAKKKTSKKKATTSPAKKKTSKKKASTSSSKKKTATKTSSKSKKKTANQKKKAGSGSKKPKRK